MTSSASNSPGRISSSRITALSAGGVSPIRMVAEGAHSEVFRAKDHLCGEDRALKLLRRPLLEKKASLAAFAREGKIGQGIGDHRNVVCTLRHGRESRGRPFIVQKWVTGGTLRDWLAQGRQFTEQDVLNICVQAVAGLAHIHRCGVIHKDLKPENLMLNEEGHVTIIDFSISTTTMIAALEFKRKVQGTPAYLSPEVLLKKKIGPSCDIWSLGITLYELLAGQTPINGKSLKEILSKIASADGADFSVRRHNRQISKATDDLICAMMRRDANTRLGCAETVLDELAKHDAMRTGTAAELIQAALKDREAAPAKKRFFGLFG